MVAVAGREHELVSSGGESVASFFVLKTVAFIVKENLLVCHVVVVENGGKDTVIFVETLILPLELLLSVDFRGRKSAARARAAGAAEHARKQTGIGCTWFEQPQFKNQTKLHALVN